MLPNSHKERTAIFLFFKHKDQLFSETGTRRSQSVKGQVKP